MLTETGIMDDFSSLEVIFITISHKILTARVTYT